jgi:hypothetical protein
MIRNGPEEEKQTFHGRVDFPVDGNKSKQIASICRHKVTDGRTEGQVWCNHKTLLGSTVRV